MRARRTAVWASVSAALAALAVTAVAQTFSPSAPVLHEDLRSPRAGSGRRQRRPPPATPSILGDEPAAGQNPTAIRDDEKILPEPAADPAAGQDEPILGQGGFGADRRTESSPDSQTQGDGTLRYVEVFNPSVVPFKRMSALAAVREDYTLVVGDASLTEVRVGGKPTAGFDRFWGSMLVDLRPGEDVPIPSVAPEMRIVSYEVEPRTQLTFSTDGADNFFVRSDEPGASGVHRLVFLAEADPRHFAPRVPSRARVADIPPSMVQPMPDRVRNLARQAYRRLGLSREMRLEEALDGLVEYFRAFEPKELVNPTGDIYWDLFSKQAGVCRHRAFAFMITANALGIPTRFLSNEAHAWVEVWVPETGWIRVDLGGAALALEVKNAAGKSMYRPRGQDPFPQPPQYRENYTRLEGDVSGLSTRQVAEAQSARPGPGGDGDGATGAGASDGSGTDGDRTATGSDGDAIDGEDPSAEPGDPGSGVDDLPLPAPGQSLPLLPDDQVRGKQPTSIRVTGASGSGFRGESIAIEGMLEDGGGAGLANQHIVLYLAPAGRGGDGARIVGHTVSDEAGAFRAQVVIPFEVELREHEVFATTPGDDDYQPSVSD